MTKNKLYKCYKRIYCWTRCVSFLIESHMKLYSITLIPPIHTYLWNVCKYMTHTYIKGIFTHWSNETRKNALPTFAYTHITSHQLKGTQPKRVYHTKSELSLIYTYTEAFFVVGSVNGSSMTTGDELNCCVSTKNMSLVNAKVNKTTRRHQTKHSTYDMDIVDMWSSVLILKYFASGDSLRFWVLMKFTNNTFCYWIVSVYYLHRI